MEKYIKKGPLIVPSAQKRAKFTNAFLLGAVGRTLDILHKCEIPYTADNQRIRGVKE